MKTETINIRGSKERGFANHGWLKSHHSFSFGEYYDPEHMGFRSLRVINDDRIAPKGGFPMHPHRDMEIFSYVVSGSIHHEDSMGNQRTLKRGEIQLMSAGKGIRHSEYNPSHEEELHLLQIWLIPNTLGLTPSYTEWQRADDQAEFEKVLVISPDGRDSSAIIHQDAFIYLVKLSAEKEISHKLENGRGMWIQVIKGSVSVAGAELHAGDALSTESPDLYTLKAQAGTELILFDLI
jgi:quercetin 2,3-dioxygenase